MLVFRRRLVYWIIKEYVKKWGKTLLASFFIGLGVFFILTLFIRYFTPKIPVGNNESIGIVGAYRVESLPLHILGDISKGLTAVSQDGRPVPSLARQWKIEQDGKKYTFFLRNDVFFTDGTKVTSDAISYRFSDVKVLRPNKQTIIFELKESYSPFLVAVSRPIIKKGFVGVGSYVVKSTKINGDFVQTLVLSLYGNPYKTKTYQFYPSYEALKMAYSLGETSKAYGLPDITYKKTSFDKFQNTYVTKKTNYNYLVTTFYNTKDNVLSDKRLRSALTYALPNNFSEGERTHNPIAPSSFAYIENFSIEQDIEQAKILLSAASSATKSATLKLEIKTLSKYSKTAQEVARSWNKIGIETDIVVTDKVPEKFQVFLGDYFLPKDPDQYTLWHTDQINNITRYDSKRIDKLLEDGRKITDLEERKKIYADFQKYLLADSPATFLYFPYEYELTRK